VRARSALFTLFGDVVRPAGGEAWLSTLTACMGALGFTPEATRTALHRMAAEGWVEPRKVGRYAVYRLTPRGIDRLEEAAARIYRLRAVDWDGRWRLLVLPRGSAAGELGKALAWVGFGRLTPELWVSPHHHGQRLTTLLAEHGQVGAHRFTSEAAADDDRDRRIVDEAWDLGELRTAQEGFCTRWAEVPAPPTPQAAFRTRIELVHHWRSFLFLDPGLPVSLLPAGWLGDDAAALFRERYLALEPASWSFLEREAAPPAPALTAADPPSSPFPPAPGDDLDDLTGAAASHTPSTTHRRKAHHVV
jgi:phenylacetic acid degradation operon negative regulatory protein